MAGHAKLSPSAADRWFACPASIVLSAQMPERESSDYAKEGTLAHSYAQAVLTGQPRPEVSDEMARFVKVYTDHVRDLVLPGCQIFVEQQVQINHDVWGTADALVWNPQTKVLYVRDLKYGEGIPVKTENNLQLKTYALAAITKLQVPATGVNIGIIQPRLELDGDDYQPCEFAVADLLDFYSDITDTVVRIQTMEKNWPTMDDAARGAYFGPSEKACRWCLGAPICPKQKALAKEALQKAFGPGATDYSPAELADILATLDALEAYTKNLREFAYAEAEKGRTIPGWKLVDKRATRKWKDPEEAAAQLTGVIGPDIYKPQEIVSPAQAEELLPKDMRSLLKNLTVKESSGHTLVPESDKREAVRLDAQSAFANA